MYVCSALHTHTCSICIYTWSCIPHHITRTTYCCARTMPQDGSTYSKLYIQCTCTDYVSIVYNLTRMRIIRTSKNRLFMCTGPCCVPLNILTFCTQHLLYMVLCSVLHRHIISAVFSSIHIVVSDRILCTTCVHTMYLVASILPALLPTPIQHEIHAKYDTRDYAWCMYVVCSCGVMCRAHYQDVQLSHYYSI